MKEIEKQSNNKNLRRGNPAWGKRADGTGKSGNPNGKPHNEASITAKQREMLPLPCPYAPGKTWLEWLADRGMALAGENAGYYRELMDRLEGKVTQPVEGRIIGDVVFNIGKGYARNGNEDNPA